MPAVFLPPHQISRFRQLANRLGDGVGQIDRQQNRDDQRNQEEPQNQSLHGGNPVVDDRRLTAEHQTAQDASVFLHRNGG